MSRLLRWKLLIWWRKATASDSSKIGFGLGSILGFIWFILVFVASRSLFYLLQGFNQAQAELAAGEIELLAAAYLVTLAICLFTACGTAFAVMYSSSDLPILFAAPLSVQQVFALKFTEIMGAVSLPLLFTIVPLLLGYGAGVGAGWQYYPLLLLLSLSVLFLSTSLGTALNLVVMRIIPPYRTKELGVALGSLLGGLIYALIQFGGQRIGGLAPEQLVEVTGSFSLAQAGFSPALWLAQATANASRGLGGPFWFWFALATGSALGLLTLSFLLVQEAFYGGWAGSGEVRRKKGRAKKKGSREKGKLGARLFAGAPVAAVARKEFKTVARDMREWSQAIYMVVVMGAAIFAPMMGRGDTLGGGSIGLYLGFVWVYFLVTMLASSLSVSAVAREGKSWLLVRSTPITCRHILWGKMLGILPLVLGGGLVISLLLIHLLGGGARQLLLTAGFLLLVTPGLVAINLATGTIEPKFSATDPRKRNSVGAVLGGFVLAGCFGGAVALGIRLIQAANPLWSILGVALLLGGGVAAVILPIVTASRSLEALEPGNTAGL